MFTGVAWVAASGKAWKVFIWLFNEWVIEADPPHWLEGEIKIEQVGRDSHFVAHHDFPESTKALCLALEEHGFSLPLPLAHDRGPGQIFAKLQQQNFKSNEAMATFARDQRARSMFVIKVAFVSIYLQRKTLVSWSTEHTPHNVQPVLNSVPPSLWRQKTSQDTAFSSQRIICLLLSIVRRQQWDVKISSPPLFFNFARMYPSRWNYNVSPNCVFRIKTMQRTGEYNAAVHD